MKSLGKFIQLNSVGSRLVFLQLVTRSQGKRDLDLLFLFLNFFLLTLTKHISKMSMIILTSDLIFSIVAQAFIVEVKWNVFVISCRVYVGLECNPFNEETNEL